MNSLLWEGSQVINSLTYSFIYEYQDLKWTKLGIFEKGLDTKIDIFNTTVTWCIEKLNTQSHALYTHFLC